MFVRLFCYGVVLAITASDNSDEHFHPHMPFFVMQPHTIINQTLHSYCKEQSEFNIQPMYINLTQWPSGFIYARNPQQKLADRNDVDDMNDFSVRECTTELQATAGDRIRLVFYPISNDYDQDYFLTIPKVPCLKIRDSFETTTFECPMILERNKSTGLHRPSDDYLSNSDTIYLEMLLPPSFANDYDDSYHHFKLLFTTLTPKVTTNARSDRSVCPRDRLLDCDDGYCAHLNTRCNGITECRSKVDEESCKEEISRARPASPFTINTMRLFIIVIHLSTL